MQSLPNVSVLIATYNYEKFIGDAIESILKQTYPIEKIQIVVVDDGSIDETSKVVSNYKSKVDLTYIYQNNNGKASATSLGRNYITGKYTFILDADDWYLPDCIKTVTKCFESNPEIAQVSHFAYRFDEKINKMIPQKVNHSYLNEAYEGRLIFEKSIFERINIGIGSTFAIRTDTFRSFDIPETIDMYIDYHLFLKASSRGKIVQLDQTLSVFRRHSRSYSEGVEKFETGKARSLRYLKSARSIYEESRAKDYDDKVTRYFKLFYYKHLLSAAKYTSEGKFNIALKIIALTLSTMHHYKNSSKFFLNNIKSAVRPFLKS